MDRYQVSMGLLFLRLGAGALLIYSRSGRWPEMIAAWNPSVSDPLGFGGHFHWIFTLFSEAICTLLVMMGMFTRFACIPPLVLSVVAALAMPASTAWSVREGFLLYALPFFVLSFTGPGEYSVDSRVAQWSR
jgi:putative oxidoreductase